jgi:cytoskeleton protein RodZ
MTDVAAATGPRLKAERERRGLSPQKAADELHLDGWVIDALEAEDYQRVGPAVYAKGHLKRYAALLGLPSDEIMAGYETRAQAPKPSAAQPANVRLHTDAPAVRNLPWPPSANNTVMAVLLALGVFWWKPWHPRGSAPSAAQPLAANLRSAPADAAADAAGPMAASAAPSAMPPGPSSSPPAPTPSDAAAGMGRARIRLSFSADSWVDIRDAAGRRVFAGKGRANSVKTLGGVAPLRVYLGFASGVQLEINSRVVAIGPQFVAGDVARFEAGADGVLRRDSHNAATPAVAPPAATSVARPAMTAPAVPAPAVATHAVAPPGAQAPVARPTG